MTTLVPKRAIPGWRPFSMLLGERWFSSFAQVQPTQLYVRSDGGAVEGKGCRIARHRIGHTTPTVLEPGTFHEPADVMRMRVDELLEYIAAAVARSRRASAFTA